MDWTYLIAVAGSDAIVMAAAFVLNSMLDEGPLQREHYEQSKVSSRPKLGRTHAYRNETEG